MFGTVERVRPSFGPVRRRNILSSPAAFLDADLEFQVVLAEASGNRYIVPAMTEIRSLLKQRRP